MPKNPHAVLYDQYGNPLALSEKFELGVSGQATTGFAPEFTSHLQGRLSPSVDPENQLAVRGPVLTDEGSFRDDFSGSSLLTNLTGVCTFTNASPVVTGVGTKFLSEVGRNRFLRLTGHTNTCFVQVDSVISDEELTLVSPYSGANGAGVGIKSFWVPTVAAGGGLLVSGSNLLLTPGLAVGETKVVCAGDYLPMVLEFTAILSLPQSQQTLSVGLESADGLTYARMLIGGSIPLNKVKFQCSSDGGATLNEGTADVSEWGTVQRIIRYQIDVRATDTTLSVEGHTILTHHTHIPGPSTVLLPTLRIANAAAALSLSYLVCDHVYTGNANLVQVETQHRGALQSQLMALDTDGCLMAVASDHQGRLHATLPQVLDAADGTPRTVVHDEQVARVLEAIWTELRLMNLHLAVMSDEDFSYRDVE